MKEGRGGGLHLSTCQGDVVLALHARTKAQAGT